MAIELALRFVGGVVAGIGAWDLASRQLVAGAVDPETTFLALFAIVAASFGIAFLVTPYLTTRPFFWLLDTMSHLATADLLATVIGALLGLLIGVLLAYPLSLLPAPFGPLLPTAISLASGYLGVQAALARRSDVLAFLGRSGPAAGSPAAHRVLLDSSAAIDGRVVDLVRTGFLAGPLIVPRFVLAELQRVADSPEPQRRARGRRGLEVLARLQQDAAVPIEVREMDADASETVDSQLVSAAKAFRCSILTTDYNLNRVATLQGVPVLNVNDLAGAVRSAVLPGEILSVRLIQEGKEFGQGVGYLDDGTMVVVENGRHLLNSVARVTVSRVLQTTTGRMIFAHARSSPGSGHATFATGSRL